MNIKLDKELESLKRREDKERQASAVKEVKLLMEADASEEIRILSNLTRNSTFSRAQKNKGEDKEREELEKKYGKVFTQDQIKDLCVRYKMRFLPSGLYIGDVDVEMTAKIKEFAQLAISNVIDNHSLQTQFFIMAPPEAFDLETVREERRVVSYDVEPLLFYNLGNGFYRLVHKWGRDFTILRRIVGWKWASINNFLTFKIVCQIPFLFMLFAFLFPVFLINHPIGMSILALVLSFFIALIRCGRRIVWDSNNEIRRLYFTEHNWNNNKILKGGQ